MDDPVLVLHEAHLHVAGITSEETVVLEMQHVDATLPRGCAHGRSVLSGKRPESPPAFQTGGETPLVAPAALGTVIQKAAPEGPAVGAAPGISFHQRG